MHISFTCRWALLSPASASLGVRNVQEELHDMKLKIRASAYTQVLSPARGPHTTHLSLLWQHGVNVRRLFRTIDRDRDGLVNLDEFSRAMRRGRITAYRMSDTQVQHLFDLIDKNGNGVISLDEFVEFVGDDERQHRTLCCSVDRHRVAYRSLLAL